eukprot:1791147-Rhodomonas_salina.1
MVRRADRARVTISRRSVLGWLAASSERSSWTTNSGFSIPFWSIASSVLSCRKRMGCCGSSGRGGAGFRHGKTVLSIVTLCRAT